MRLPRRFEWLADEDSTSTHLTLAKGQTYNAGDVAAEMLIAWKKVGMLRFVDDLEGEAVPESVRLEVQNIRIKFKPKKPKEDPNG